MKTKLLFLAVALGLCVHAHAQVSVKVIAVSNANFTAVWTNTDPRTAYELIAVEQRLGSAGSNTFTISYSPAMSNTVMNVLNYYEGGSFVMCTVSNDYGTERPVYMGPFPVIRPTDKVTFVGNGGENDSILKTNTTILIWYKQLLRYWY